MTTPCHATAPATAFPNPGPLPITAAHIACTPVLRPRPGPDAREKGKLATITINHILSKSLLARVDAVAAPLCTARNGDGPEADGAAGIWGHWGWGRRRVVLTDGKGSFKRSLRAECADWVCDDG